MIESFWNAVAGKIVNNPDRVKRIIAKGGAPLLGGSVIFPKVGQPVTEIEGARVIVLQGTIVLLDADENRTWQMTGDTFVNDRELYVGAIEKGAAVLVI